MRKQKDDMQMNVAGLRRNIKNLAHNYSDAQVKVREATSNDPWGPSATIMAEVADLTYNVVAFSEIMQMIWKRLNDHGKNWRHVYKALILLEYLIKTGSERVAQQCKENIFAIQTLREFVYFEEGKDQGIHVREKAKQLVILLRDEERLKNERAKALKAKERFAQHPSGFGSDGYIEGPTNRETPPGWRDEAPKPGDVDFVRPQTAGEEELQLQLAMAMSREEAEQEEAKRRSDDVRLQLALSQSEQDFKQTGSPRRPNDRKEDPKQSHLMDLLDISLGATSLNSPTEGAVGTTDPWSTPTNPIHTRADPWSGAASPPVDPWLGSKRPPISVGATATDTWRTHSPSIPPHVPGETWSRNSTPTSALNGNVVVGDPWAVPRGPPSEDPWLAPKAEDPWLPKANVSGDTWISPNNLESRPSPVGAITSPISDLDEFDIITNRNKTGQSNGNGVNNNNYDMDPLSSKKSIKSPQSFLGENSSLVNLDNLIKPVVPNSTTVGSAPYNPFSDTNLASATAPIVSKPNLFQQQQPAVPSINQLKQQPFPVTLNQDPWAPVNSNNATAQPLDDYFFDCETDKLAPKTAINKNNNNGSSINTKYNNDSTISSDSNYAAIQMNLNSIDNHFYINPNPIANDTDILMLNSHNDKINQPATAAAAAINSLIADNLNLNNSKINNANNTIPYNINNTPRGSENILSFDNINYLDPTMDAWTLK